MKTDPSEIVQQTLVTHVQWRSSHSSLNPLVSIEGPQMNLLPLGNPLGVGRQGEIRERVEKNKGYIETPGREREGRALDSCIGHRVASEKELKRVESEWNMGWRRRQRMFLG
ncbi:hypothetical protein CDAR_18441 [Caerostris darwini]|uniref:Uncharacterized protein n=1 Tax=Caerostris darwini TaxID=1538125 RepID=A0AAV4VBD6_9ARAC|nr:hypothetical protein CDAR_18441 [Caerostris darwini]